MQVACTLEMSWRSVNLFAFMVFSHLSLQYESGLVYNEALFDMWIKNVVK